MNNQLLLFILLASFSAISFSQQERDVVFLNDGSIIKGMLTEKDEKTIQIETCCGNLLVFEKADILKMEKETIPKSKFQVKQKGYMNFTSMGFLVGSPANEKIAPFSIISEHTYRVNEYIAVGGLIGYELLEESIVPLGVNIKGFVFDGADNLFLGITGGFSLSLENPNKDLYNSASGGPFFTIEMGVLIPVSGNNSFFVAMGYRYNKLKYERTDWWLSDVEREVKYNRISIRLGLTLY